MSLKQEKANRTNKGLFFAQKFWNKKEAYYKIGKDFIEVMFVVDRNNASSLISYLNSLFSIIEKEVKGITVESSVYIYDSAKK